MGAAAVAARGAATRAAAMAGRIALVNLEDMMAYVCMCVRGGRGLMFLEKKKKKGAVNAEERKKRRKRRLESEACLSRRRATGWWGKTKAEQKEKVWSCRGILGNWAGLMLL